MFNDISCGTKDNEQECLAHARVVSLYARRFGTGQWSFIGPGSEKKWYSIKEDSPQGIWDNIAAKMLVEFAESGCPIFRATTPLSRGQLRSKGHGKLSIHFAATQETIEIFRTIVSAKSAQSLRSSRGNCEEYESLHDRSGATWSIVKGQSIVLSAIKTEVSLDCDDPTNENLLLQQYGERIEKLSQEDKWSKICTDAGFLNVVEIGQYFRTKDTPHLSLFHAVACREYTLPEGRWIITTKRMDPGKHKNWTPCWKLQPIACMVNMEWRLEFGPLHGDNTHSWVRISHGLNQFCDGFE